MRGGGGTRFFLTGFFYGPVPTQGAQQVRTPIRGPIPGPPTRDDLVSPAPEEMLLPRGFCSRATNTPPPTSRGGAVSKTPGRTGPSGFPGGGGGLGLNRGARGGRVDQRGGAPRGARRGAPKRFFVRRACPGGARVGTWGTKSPPTGGLGGGAPGSPRRPFHWGEKKGVSPGGGGPRRFQPGDFQGGLPFWKQPGGFAGGQAVCFFSRGPFEVPRPGRTRGGGFSNIFMSLENPRHSGAFFGFGPPPTPNLPISGRRGIFTGAGGGGAGLISQAKI